MTDSANLAAMRVADLQSLAGELGIKGSARMRKSQLVDAITAAREASADVTTTAAAETDEAVSGTAGTEARADETAGADASDQGAADAERDDRAAATGRSARGRASDDDASTDDASPTPAVEAADPTAEQDAGENAEQGDDRRAEQLGDEDAAQARDDAEPADDDADRPARGRRRRATAPQQAAKPAADTKPAKPDAEKSDERDGRRAPKSLDDIVLPPARDDEDDSSSDDGDDAREQSGGGRKRSRSRNRNKNADKSGDDQSGQGSGQQSNGPADKAGSGSDKGTASNRQRDRRRERRDDVDPEIAPDDVLLPIAGILDVLDNYAFVRTSGYLAGPNDVYVSLGQVKKYGLRKGDAIVGAIRQPREGEQQSGRQKYNALAKIDTINGTTPEQSKDRPEFDTLTPLYPDERIRLETKNGHAAQRMIDLFAPIGKGTRGLVIAPPKSGKSIMLERIANAIAHNSPDTHLMLVLVDERPEEVTRLERTIHGEVVSSTFDMPAENHTTIAELAIERAKRLVELGLDVVMLLDSITQLGRAYNLTAPVSGRIIAGGIDASAVYPPKRFFGAARKIENGGSLTILATAMVETGSRTDEVILEEFAGTGNMELRLSREIADKRIFPALDIQQSSTLHESQLLTADELEVTWSIRRALNGDAQGVLEAVLERMSATSSNEEFLASVRANPIKAAAKATR